MRHLILLLALFSASTFLSAQCDINVNFLTAECNEDATSFTVTFTVESSVDGEWFIPNFNLAGALNSGEVYESGPWPPSSAGGVFNIFRTGQDSCFTTVTFPEIACDDPCFDFTVFADQQTVVCGPNGETFLFVNWQTSSFPIVIDLLNEDGFIFSTDTFPEGDFFETLIPNWSLFTLVVTNGDGCIEEIQIDEPLFSCSSVSGRSWFDENRNGIRDDGEDEAVQATVSLYRADGFLIDSVHTAFNGTYRFDIFNQDEAYYLEIFPDNASQSLTTSGLGEFCTGSDFNPQNSRTEIFVAAPGLIQECLDAGWRSGGCGQVGFEVFTIFPDLPCTPGIPSVFISGGNADFPFTLTITDQQSGDIQVAETITEGGTYSFNELPGDFYTVEINSASGCTLNGEFDNNALSPLPLAIIQEGSICSDAGIFLNADVGFDVPEVTYLWSTGETTPSIQATELNTNYFLQVFTEEGCTGFASIFVSGQGGQNDTIDIDPVYTLGCEGEPVTISINNPQEGYTYTWFGPQVNSLTGESITTAVPGFYEVVSNFGPNCFAFGLTQVLDLSLGDITLEPFANDSICGAGTCIGLSGLNLFNDDSQIEVFWDGPPSFDEWFAQQTFPVQRICGFEDGLYSVTITTACDTVVVTYDSTSPDCSEISGTLYLDGDGNCQLGEGDTPAPGFVLALTNDATGEMYYAWTGEDGTWSILLPDGTYTVEPIIEEGQPLEVCEPATTATLNGTPVSGVNIFMPVLFDCPVLTTEVTIPFLRRCFQGCAYVNYENSGTATGEDAQVTVVLDPFFIDVIPSIDPVSVEGNVYTFNVGDLPPFAGGTIGFIFTISCDAELGQSHCIDASITPDDFCHDNPAWNGALVEIISAECLGDSLVFTVSNVGENQMSIPLNYVIVEDGIMLSEEPIINGQLIPGEAYTITMEANGSTYAVITNQEPNAPGTDQPTAVFEGCNGNGNSFSTGFANLLPLASGNPARSTVCRENVGSYDPNDKMGYPLGWDGGNIEKGTRLDYEIRFQNTGTDTAFTVVVSDTLSADLDLATFKMEAASHLYTIAIDTHRVITWTFDNILLPDSSTNLLLSQGSIVFSIDHDDSLVPGDEITNEAAIYFDFNEPIITNVSKHIIAKEGLPVGLRSLQAQSINLSVYPNPASDIIKVNVPAEALQANDLLQVTDLHGRPLMSVPYGQLGRGLNVSQLPAGYYLLLVNDATSGLVKGRAAFVVTNH